MRPGARVLFVEDDRYIAELVKMELEHHGLELMWANDGPSGLQAMGRFDPDVIVLDVMLPRTRCGCAGSVTATECSRS
jgi:DNA-binding response OmpR family regulator